MKYLLNVFWVIVILLSSCAVVHTPVKKKTAASPAINEGVSSDTVPGRKLKPYPQIITGKAITYDGLIKAHLVNERFYFEISDSLLDKDILVVNRISKGSASGSLAYGLIGYGGDYIGENVIRFTKGPNQKIFINRMSYRHFSFDSSDNGMYRSVLNSSLQPIVASFDIKAINTGSSGYVIDVHDYLNSENSVFSFNSKLKEVIELGALMPDRSFIRSIHSFPKNTEIKTVKTYNSKDNIITYELNSSIVLLPAQTMKPRYNDDRVGYFSRGYLDFDAPEGVRDNYMITRWKLEPREQDKAAYLRGELVEPVKPIVFYIDPATPKKWVPYLIEGVNAWQSAFEKAGFKKAIYALEAPVGDTSWSIEDARHNVIVYKASALQNASGPQVSDPRSGEILESHINWYHNVQGLLRDWYFLQSAVNDPRARKMNFDDELMGTLIRYVCTHEVGHTLGLQHNFVASAAIPVDSLRSSRYVSAHSHTPSIMDYARFNYVAQPQDGIAASDLIPRIGVYDEWAIEWGYRWYPEFKSAEEEKTWFNQLIVKKLKEDKLCYYLPPNYPDARNQQEDLGDDAVKAGSYGISNLKLLMKNLNTWARVPNDDYSEMRRMFKGIWNTYNQYVNHALSYLMKLHMNPITVEQGGPWLWYPSRQRMQSAIGFLDEQLFQTPHWINDKTMFGLGAGGGSIDLFRIQSRTIHKLVNASNWNHLLFNQEHLPSDSAFTFKELLDELEARIFSELKSDKPIEMNRRNLQKLYVGELILMMRYSLPSDLGRMDLAQIGNVQIAGLYSKLKSAGKKFKDPMSASHLRELANRLQQCLHYQKYEYSDEVIKYGKGGSGGERAITTPDADGIRNSPAHDHKNCWQSIVPERP